MEPGFSRLATHVSLLVVAVLASVCAHGATLARHRGGTIGCGPLTLITDAIPKERPAAKGIEEAHAWGNSMVKRWLASEVLRRDWPDNQDRHNIEGLRQKQEIVFLVEAFQAQQATLETEVAEAAIEAYYRENSDRFEVPGTVSFRHIFFYPGEDPTAEDWVQAEQRAQAAYRELASGADFAEVARQRCELAVPPEQKGSLLQRAVGVLSSEVEAYMLSGARGVALPPLRTRHGYEVFMTESVTQAHTQALADVRDAIRRDREQRERTRQWQLVLDEAAAIPAVMHPELVDATPEDPGTPLLMVGPYTLTWADFERSFGYDNPDNRTLESIRDPEKRVDWFRDRATEFQWALYMRQRGYLDRPGAAQRLATAQDWVIGDYLLHRKALQQLPAEPTKADLQEYYDTHKEDFALPDRWGGQRIVFSTGLAADASRAEFGRAVQRLFPLVSEVHRNAARGEDFSALARAHSDAPEGSAGGYLSPDEAAACYQFQSETASLAEGGISGIVVLPEQQGYAIYRKGKVIPGGYRNLEDCDACGLAVRTLLRWRQVQDVKARMVDEIAAAENLRLDEEAILRWAITIRPRSGEQVFQPAMMYAVEAQDATAVRWPLRMACANLAPSDFHALGTTEGIVRSTTAVWSERGRETVLIAPVHVPEGAIIIAFGVSVEDRLLQSPVEGEIVILDVHAKGGPASEDVRGTITTEPAENMSGQRVHGMGLWIPADNQNQIYQLRLRLPAGDRRQMVFSGLLFYLTREPEGRPLDSGILSRLTDPECIRACCGGHLPVGAHVP